ncbi:hypothetical protein RJ639_017901 [Escallonia herrerae]|uniref:DUF1232 domain-containing protein n=1 Tax=Escallonia herrerae TaxID=1293975 RepID=A0AA88VDJ3_9ASTE|nr:hypothetical protein RJ639_017901 [Escallonia herrerae]
MAGPPANDWCSVCHGNFHIPCQANCSHWFCGASLLLFLPLRIITPVGNCILQVWNHGPAFQPCTCPLCRRQITLLVPSDASSQHHNDSEVSEILGKVEAYNRLFGLRTNGLSQRLQDLPFLLRRLLREMLNPQRSLPLVVKARVFLAVKYITQQGSVCSISMVLSAIYLISPVDIIPEAIFGIIGLLDDLVIVLVCFLHVAALYRSVLLYRHGGS